MKDNFIIACIGACFVCLYVLDVLQGTKISRLEETVLMKTEFIKFQAEFNEQSLTIHDNQAELSDLQATINSNDLKITDLLTERLFYLEGIAVEFDKDSRSRGWLP